ncbi:hypothetical protein BJV82DRAFT_584401 [Fennellomyces sp. T-0311]|nr:hypothetical protein BJV82DRAFT_584401 [Fennellomyces sp. T-0311]
MHERREHEDEASKIESVGIHQMVEAVNGGFTVLADQTHVISCFCYYFEFKKRPCKHMFLVTRYDTSMKVPIVTVAPLVNIDYREHQHHNSNTSASSSSYNNAFSSTVNESASTRNTERANKLKLMLQQMTRHINDRLFDDADEEALDDIISQLGNVQERLNNLGRASNRRLQTQRPPQ